MSTDNVIYGLPVNGNVVAVVIAAAAAADSVCLSNQSIVVVVLACLLLSLSLSWLSALAIWSAVVVVLLCVCVVRPITKAAAAASSRYRLSHLLRRHSEKRGDPRPSLCSGKAATHAAYTVCAAFLRSFVRRQGETSKRF